MSMIRDLLADIALPKMVKVGQRFPTPEVEDVAGALREEIRRTETAGRVKPGMRVAVCVGSRGIGEIPLIVRVTIEELKRLGAEPFIVPAMGSHGGATAEGQVQVLARLGVTEESAGCRIHSSMDVVELGALDNGLPVLVDRNAYEADGIVVINRVKAHDGFSGPHESGLVKMITIGLGKQKGADSAHVPGFGYMGELSLKMAEIKLAKLPCLFGVATVENAHHKVAHIRAIGADKIIDGDRELLVEAKSMMPNLLLAPFDVLVVDQLGKEYSGGGMDPHTTGRTATPFVKAGPPPTRLVVLDVTERSLGNCCGVGNADITTRRLFNKMDQEYTYTNVLTSTVTNSGRVGLIMDSDKLAIQAALKTCNVIDQSKATVARIANTLHITEMFISESMLDEARKHEKIEILSGADPWVFDGNGDLTDIGLWHQRD
jgi:hypothetical protein